MRGSKFAQLVLMVPLKPFGINLEFIKENKEYQLRTNGASKILIFSLLLHWRWLPFWYRRVPLFCSVYFGDFDVSLWFSYYLGTIMIDKDVW